jgi:hypothetical protein
MTSVGEVMEDRGLGDPSSWDTRFGSTPRRSRAPDVAADELPDSGLVERPLAAEPQPQAGVALTGIV